jgi:hypothetical protein
MASASARWRSLFRETGYGANRNHLGNRGEICVVIQVLLFILFLLMLKGGPACLAPTVFGALGAIAY